MMLSRLVGVKPALVVSRYAGSRLFLEWELTIPLVPGAFYRADWWRFGVGGVALAARRGRARSAPLEHRLLNTAADTQMAGATVTISAGLSAGDVLDFVNTASISADGSFGYDPNGAFDWLAAGENATESFT